MTTTRTMTASSFLLLAAFTSACAGHQAKQPFDSERYVNAWVELWNSYDLSLVDELFVTDSSVTYFSSEREGLITGIEAVREHHATFGFVPEGRPAEQDLWVEDVHTEVFWPAAIVTGLWFFGDEDDGRNQAQTGPFTFVYVQRGDTYRLAHLNFGTYPTSPEREEG